MSMIGYDFDGVLTAGVQPDGNFWCVISGRTWPEYDQFLRSVAVLAPVYIRGDGAYGDREAAGHFKAKMIALLGVAEFHEDDPLQIAIIAAANPNVKVIAHGQAAPNSGAVSSKLGDG